MKNNPYLCSMKKALKIIPFAIMLALAVGATLSFDTPRCRCYERQYEVKELLTIYPEVTYRIERIGFNSISCKEPIELEYPEGPWIGMEVGDKYSTLEKFCPNGK